MSPSWPPSCPVPSPVLNAAAPCVHHASVLPAAQLEATPSSLELACRKFFSEPHEPWAVDGAGGSCVGSRLGSLQGISATHPMTVISAPCHLPGDATGRKGSAWGLCVFTTFLPPVLSKKCRADLNATLSVAVVSGFASLLV